MSSAKKTALADANHLDFILFGATGDLSMRKLLPALYRAMVANQLPESCAIRLCYRKDSDGDVLIDKVSHALTTYLDSNEFTDSSWQQFQALLVPTQIDLANINKGWRELSQSLEGHEECNRLFYLAVAPSFFQNACENLSTQNLITPASKIVVEKPLGYDYDSAEVINESLAQYFQENQIYRIDHYLGKEPVQNLLALRFSNFIFENIWDARSIDSVQISINEQVGLEGRAGFYDGAGAMRDMIQNHLLQLLCLVAMESPNRMDADEVRQEKIKVLRALRPIRANEATDYTVAGQYAPGIIENKAVAGYLDELGNEQSSTETFIAISARIENWRWAGVPFYLRTGKRLKKRFAEIVIQFKSVTHKVFGAEQSLQPNKLIISLQPEEKVELTLMSKKLGSPSQELIPMKLSLDVDKKQQGARPTAYQRLMLDAINGDPTLFIHRDEVKAAWYWIDPIIKFWQNSENRPYMYPAGEWGPKQAEELLAKNKHRWHNPVK